MKVQSITCVRCGASIVSSSKDAEAICPRCKNDGPTQTNNGENAAVSPTLTGPSGSGLRSPRKSDEIGRLGNYRILSLLGAGGMGAVYKAEDIDLRRLVALKVMLPQMAASPVARERFLREARAAAKVEHDHIVPIHQVGEDHGTAYLAMPLLKGETLSDRIKREGPLPPAEALRIAREIALGLAAAHEEGLIHRDIKPGNIWLEAASRRVRILDFGLARLADADESEAHLTESGAVVGTPAYMSPEQGRHEALDARSDLFSLGTVLYQMLTGHLPFRGKSTMALLTALAVDDPVAPEEISPAVDNETSNFVLKLLSKKRGDRPPTGSDVARSLGRILTSLMATPTDIGPWNSLDDESLKSERPTSKRQKPKRPVALVWGLVCAVSLLIVLGAVLLWLAMRTPKGMVRFESDDATAEIIVRKNGAIVVDRTRSREIVLPAGEYTAELAEKPPGMKLSLERFEIPKRGSVTIRVIRERPTVAIKPKDKEAVPDPKDVIARPAAFRVPLSGLGMGSSLEPSSAPDGWRKDGVFAEVKGKGTIVYPTIEANSFVVEFDVEVRGAGEMAIKLGDIRVFHPDLRLSRPNQGLTVQARLLRRHLKSFLTGDPAQVPGRQRLAYRLVVDGAATMLMQNESVLRSTPVGAVATLRIEGLAADTDVTMHSCRMRLPTAAENELLQQRLSEPQPKETPGQDGNPPAPKISPSNDYREVHGATEAELFKWADALPLGFRPVWLSARIGANPPIFDALAYKFVETTEWKLRVGDFMEREKDWDEMNKTHRLAFSVDFPAGKVRKSACVWVKDAYGWSGWRANEGFIKTRAEEARKAGQRPVSLTAEDDRGAGSFRMVTAAALGPAWEIQIDLSAATLDDEVKRQRERGWRAELIHVCTFGNKVRYLALFSENTLNNAWEFKSGLTPAEYERELETQSKEGLWPKCVTSTVENGNVKYSAVWVGTSSR